MLLRAAAAEAEARLKESEQDCPANLDAKSILHERVQTAVAIECSACFTIVYLANPQQRHQLVALSASHWRLAQRGLMSKG